MFLEKNKVIYIEKKKDKEEKIISQDNKEIKEKVVLLINGGTASGSEIMASSLKENNDITLIGTSTYGKNTIQKIHNLKDNSIVKFTIGEWTTSTGKSIKNEKVNPDIIVENNNCCDRNTENDEMLNKALGIFK
jgi:carboxyl-terminal processing protease